MENNVNYYEREMEFHVFVASTFSDLANFKKAGDTESFNQLLLKAMPEVERYVQKRLNRAVANNRIDRGKYKADDFTDQLFIEAFDHFDEIENEKDLHPWLFKKADELMEDALVEEEFDTLFFDNIDDYSKPEWEAMEEKFSTDGGGDLVMLEELDDKRLGKNDYTLDHVFIEDTEKELAVKLDQTLDEDRVQHHINMVLNKLPSLAHTVFDLFHQQQFGAAEIAKIKNITIQEVEKLLADTKRKLQASFSKRFLIDSN